MNKSEPCKEVNPVFHVATSISFGDPLKDQLQGAGYLISDLCHSIKFDKDRGKERLYTFKASPAQMIDICDCS